MYEKIIKLLLIIFSIFISNFILVVKTYAFEQNTIKQNDLSEEKRIKIEKCIEEKMDEGNIPGMSIAIISEDKTIYQRGFGYVDIQDKKPVTSKSLFEIGSNSKAFTALGILNLQKNGLIELSDKVDKYIPWLKVKYKGKYVELTIDQLLHHTSGIPFGTIDKIPISNSNNSLEETVKRLINVELDSEPGEVFQYATINYDILGLIIQNVTGISYEEYIKNKILVPIGLTNTYVGKSEDVEEYLSKGYKISLFKEREYNAPIYKGNTPAGYIISNIEDMAKWVKIQMGVIDIPEFDKNIIEYSHRINKEEVPLISGLYYSSGWFFYENNNEEFLHGGNNPNYSSFIIIRPEDKIGIIVLSNINSDYISEVAEGIKGILNDKEYNQNTKDFNKSADIIATFIIFIESLISIKVYTIYL